MPINATTPGSNWEAPGNGYDESSTPAVASNVVNSAGAIGAVQENYATDSGFTGSNPAKSVAEMQNASGRFTLPTPVNVASALAYATQLANGTHQLNFNGLGPNVYNPSTYSYLLTPTTGWAVAKGATMSQFVNYVLTLGQQAAPRFGYASLGLSLERYGIDEVIAHVPGAVDPTSAESAAYACGDLTPTEVQAGQTTPTCGVTNGTPPPPPPGAANIATVNGNTAAGRARAGAACQRIGGGWIGKPAAAVELTHRSRSPELHPWPVPEAIHCRSSSSVSCSSPRDGSAVAGCRVRAEMGDLHDRPVSRWRFGGLLGAGLLSLARSWRPRCPRRPGPTPTPRPWSAKAARSSHP